MKVLNRSLLLLFSFMLSACSTSTLQLNFIAHKRLNQDENHHSLPVHVRIYTLTDNEVFTESSFHDLWQCDQTTLGNTLLTKQDIYLNPGSKRQLKVSHHNDAKYIAVVALFRHPTHHQWRVIEKIPGKLFESLEHINIYLNGNTLSTQ